MISSCNDLTVALPSQRSKVTLDRKMQKELTSGRTKVRAGFVGT